MNKNNNVVVNQKKTGAMRLHQQSQQNPTTTSTITTAIALNDKQEEKTTTSSSSPPPSSALWDALFRCDWNRARERLQDYPHEALYVNCPKKAARRNSKTSSSTCLHVACQNCAPHDVIVELIAAFPAARTQQDEQRWTPLHVHLLYSNGAGSHRRRGRSHHHHDSSDAQQEEQIIITATTLALITPGAARVHANLVGSPLHLVCRHMSTTTSTSSSSSSSSSSSLTILKALLKADPRQIWIPSESGYLPTCLLWRGLMSSSSSPPSPPRSSVTAGGDNNGLILDMLYLLLQASTGRSTSKKKKNKYSDDNNEPEHHCLHQVLRFQHRLRALGDYDSDFVRLYLQEFPSSTSAWCQQEGQQLPLHVAAQLPVLSSLERQQRSSNSCMALSSFRSTTSSNLARTTFSERVATMDPLTTLLEHDDSSSSSMAAAGVPDQMTGRLPLHLALAVGRRTWYDANASGNETTTSGLQRLVHAYPEALLRVDPVTGLVPAVLAAAAAEEEEAPTAANSAKSSSSWSSHPFVSCPPPVMTVCVAANATTSTTQLETIWQLLVACPHALVVNQGE